MASKKYSPDSNKINTFRESLKGIEVPILTLDKNWYRLMNSSERREISSAQDKLNELIRRQGKLTNEARALKSIKRDLLTEIREASGQSGNNALIKEKTRLFDEAAAKLDGYKDELLDLPKLIDDANKELLLQTMIVTYRTLKENDEDIAEIEEWINEIRIDLKRHLVKKVTEEEKNKNIYSYMHKVFGAECSDLFDSVYDE